MGGFLVNRAVMKASYTSIKSSSTTKSNQTRGADGKRPIVRTCAKRELANPVDYHHRYGSMARYAKLLALRYDCNRTRHAYYRQLRLLMEHSDCDPALLGQEEVRDYLLFLKLDKQWKPQSMRQAVACLRLFFHEMLGIQPQWEVFSQIRTRDHDNLPAVLTHSEVHALLRHIRLRRYRIPIKLIYCCGLRLSECLSLTIHDIKGKEGKLIIRQGKGLKDRVVPLAEDMLEDLRAYYRFHRHPILIFPNVGRGRQCDPDELARRMHEAQSPMPGGSLQRLLVLARKEINLPDATPHSLRHSFATHLIEGGASVHTVQRLLGHKQLDTTMVYLHLTHQSTENTRALVEDLCKGLPR